MAKTEAESEPNVRHSRYLIVESRTVCEQCNETTAVYALALPAGYETLIVDGDDPDDTEGTWDVPGLPAVLSFVTYLPEAVINRIRAVTSHYRFVFEGETGVGFWTNHCEHCGAGMEEEVLHEDMDGPFGPMPAQGLESIQLRAIREPFEAWAGGQSHDIKPMDS